MLLVLAIIIRTNWIKSPLIHDIRPTHPAIYSIYIIYILYRFAELQTSTLQAYAYKMLYISIYISLYDSSQYDKLPLSNEQPTACHLPLRLPCIVSAFCLTEILWLVFARFHLTALHTLMYNSFPSYFIASLAVEIL